ncbi:tetratricopeptide repeat protein [Pelagicoccus sp. SDUM812005]|uniref:tetratricopeptide repeat protein n=1 Tax=Pelagicoccus sp. SDUM812005 TaxID=3041257 RepID=UPI00280FD84E|nr:tetratricopeptide repeat protein [Pelagicoccus sp. SDUM812005]MDQ8179325.1 tetratricopeptide repeat protein [Pelagicoccus sp. SDUM812005]
MSNFRPIVSLLAKLLLGFALAACGKAPHEDSNAALQTEPRDPSAIYQTEVEKALSQSEAGDRQALERLAKLYHANGEPSKAMQAYRRLMERDPDQPAWPHLLASLLAGFGQLREAHELQALAASKASAPLAPLLKLGELQLKLNRYDLAKETFQKAAATAPPSTHALLGLARCDIHEENWQDALSKFEKSVSIDPGFRAGWALLTTVLEHLQQSELAEIARTRSFGKQIPIPDPYLEEIDSHCYDPYQLSVAAATSNDPTSAQRLLERAIELAPNSSAYLKQLGTLYQSEGKLAAAKAYYQQATSLAPRDSESWAALIHLLMEEQNYSELSRAIDQALISCPDSGYVHFGNGKRYAMIGLYEKAKTEFQHAKRLQPNEARSYIQLSMIALMQGYLAMANQEATAALKAEPSHPDPLVMLAKIAISQKRRTEARKRIRELQDHPNRSLEDLEILEQSFRQSFRQNP